jgi:hypothetical protein
MTDMGNRSGISPTSGAVHPQSDPKTNRKSNRKSRGVLCGLLVGVLAVTLLGAPSTGFASGKAAETSRESGLGAAAAISSLVYGPVKLLYAVGGLVVGGVAWVFTAGDSEVAGTVFTRSLRGTYVITPGILLGDESLEFIGRDVPDPEPARMESVAAADTSSTVVYDESGYDEMGW